MGSAHAVVEPVGDHRAVIGCGQHEGKLASDIAHENLLGGNAIRRWIFESPTRLMPGGIFVMVGLGGFGRNRWSYGAFSCEFTQGAIP
jgi:hypothetical protein